MYFVILKELLYNRPRKNSGILNGSPPCQGSLPYRAFLVISNSELISPKRPTMTSCVHAYTHVSLIYIRKVVSKFKIFETYYIWFRIVFHPKSVPVYGLRFNKIHCRILYIYIYTNIYIRTPRLCHYSVYFVFVSGIFVVLHNIFVSFRNTRDKKKKKEIKPRLYSELWRDYGPGPEVD